MSIARLLAAAWFWLAQQLGAMPLELPLAEIQDQVEQQVVNLKGHLEPFERVVLQAQVSGYLKAIHVDLGDRVRRGEVIAELSVPELEAKTRLASVKLVKAQAELARQERIAQLKTRTSRHLHHLVRQRQGAVTAEEIDRADDEQAVAEMETQVLKAQVALAEAELENLKAMMALAKVSAPFDGIVTRRLVHTGASLSATTPIVELVATDKLRLVIEVPERIAPYLRLGNPIKARFHALPGAVFQTKLARVSAVLGDGKLRAEADLPFAPGLLPGIQAQVAIFMW